MIYAILIDTYIEYTILIYDRYTMDKIIIDLDKINDIKNGLESIIRMGQKVDSVDFRKIIKQYQTDLPEYLDEKEGKVFEYIRKNPGVSKDDVVKAMKSMDVRSRGRVFTILANLEKYDLIIVRPDKTKAKRLQIFENKKSLIIQVENNIKNFKKSYLNLIKRANLVAQEYQKIQNLRRDKLRADRPHVAHEAYSVFVNIHFTRILEQLIKGYSLKAIFEWPDKIKDPESLNRLYLMVFHMLGEVLSEHMKYSNPFEIHDEHERLEFLREGLQDHLRESTIYRDLIQEFNQYDWDTEFDSVMSDLFTALNMDIGWKDYRATLDKRIKN